MARRVQDERRIKDGEAKGGEDLDEEQGRGSFGDVGEPVVPKCVSSFHREWLPGPEQMPGRLVSGTQTTVQVEDEGFDHPGG